MYPERLALSSSTRRNSRLTMPMPVTTAKKIRMLKMLKLFTENTAQMIISQNEARLVAFTRFFNWVLSATSRSAL